MFQNQKKKKILEFAGSMAASAFLFLVIYKWIPIVYSTNDDRMIAEILSGQFTGTPESYGIQMTYGLTWLISRLYKITRNFGWYGIFLMGAQIFALGTIIYRLQSFCSSWKNKLWMFLITAGVFLSLWLKVYVQLTYTTTAAFVGLAAIFWYASSKTDGKNILMTGILANLAFSIRPNVFYMLLPATGLVYLWKIFGKKEQRPVTLAAPFMILAVTAALFLADASAYSKEGWKEFKEFFNDRTDIYDFYDLADYEEHQELYDSLGLSKEEFDLIRIYDYTILGDLPKEVFPEYLEAYRQMEQEEGITFAGKVLQAVKTFGKDVVTNAYGVENTLLFVAFGVLFCWLLWKKSYDLAIYLGIQGGTAGVLWLYFTYWSRAIERIQVTMSLISLAVLLHVLFEMQKRRLLFLPGKGVWKTVLAAGMLILGIWNGTSYRYENIQKAHTYEDVQTIKEYCAKDPDRLYYMDVATMTELYGRVTIKNTEPEYMNYIPLGDWSAYCPHYEKKLKRHGVENVAETLTGENTYVIMLHNYQVQCIKDYLNVKEAWTETIFGADGAAYAVYQFQ